MLCQLIPSKRVGEATIYVCPSCERRTKPLKVPANKVRRQCTATEQVVAPGIIQRARHYKTAIEKWIDAGKPIRTDEEVTRIVEQACGNCDLFNGKICLHDKCGCNIKLPTEERVSLIAIAISPAMTNKVRMATEDCPLVCGCGHSRWHHLCGNCDACVCQQFVATNHPRNKNK